MALDLWRGLVPQTPASVSIDILVFRGPVIAGNALAVTTSRLRQRHVAQMSENDVSYRSRHKSDAISSDVCEGGEGRA